MARPETIEDLADHERQAREFVRVDLQHLTKDVAVGAAVLGLIDAARRSECFSVDEAGEFLITVPLTEAELLSRLETAQRSWGYTSDAYSAAREGSRQVETWHRYSVNQWAKAEGLDEIDWEAHDAAFERKAS